MELKDAIEYMCSADGPNIPLRTLAVYCGTSASTMCAIKNGREEGSPRMRWQITTGLKELAAEISRTMADINVQKPPSLYEEE